MVDTRETARLQNCFQRKGFVSLRLEGSLIVRSGPFESARIRRALGLSLKFRLQSLEFPRCVSEVGRLSLEKTRKFGKRLYVFKNLNVFLMLRESSGSI